MPLSLGKEINEKIIIVANVAALCFDKNCHLSTSHSEALPASWRNDKHNRRLNPWETYNLNLSHPDNNTFVDTLYLLLLDQQDHIHVILGMQTHFIQKI